MQNFPEAVPSCCQLFFKRVASTHQMPRFTWTLPQYETIFFESLGNLDLLLG